MSLGETYFLWWYFDMTVASHCKRLNMCDEHMESIKMSISLSNFFLLKQIAKGWTHSVHIFQTYDIKCNWDVNSFQFSWIRFVLYLKKCSNIKRWNTVHFFDMFEFCLISPTDVQERPAKCEKNIDINICSLMHRTCLHSKSVLNEWKII